MNDLVVLGSEAEGLAAMLADLIAANLERDPARAALIADVSDAVVHLRVRDADVTVQLRFDGRCVTIGEVDRNANMTITTDAETLMELTNVPLRFGMPDSLRPEGRRIAQKLLRGDIKVTGLPRHLPLMVRLNRLFTVA